MFCKHCGNQIENDSIFCSYCGGRVKESANNRGDISSPNAQQTVNVNLSFGRSNINKIGEGRSQNSRVELKYDPFHAKDDTPLVLGIISLLVVFAFNLYLGMAKRVDQEIISIGQFLLLLWRIGATVWVVNIAKTLNVSPNWGWLSFFFPGVTLIVLGLMKKRLYPNNYNDLNYKDQSKINNNIANQFSKRKDYLNALYFADKSIALDSGNHYAYDTRGYIKYFLKYYKEALTDFDESIALDNSNPLKYYHRGYAKKELGDIKGAFDDWTTASKNGYSSADESIKKFCADLKFDGSV